MTAKELKDILVYGEHISLECKSAQNEVPKSVWESYSAFANTNGGIILLGVSENRKACTPLERYPITGVENAEKILTDFWNTINGEKVNVNILRDEDVEVIDVDGKNVIAITVPQAEYSSRPVYINGNPIKGTFKRNYEGDYHCRESEIKMMMRDATDEGNDGMLLEHYTMEDLDSSTVAAYRRMFVQNNPDHVWNNYDDKSFLTMLGCIGRDRAASKEWLTLAGLMMFGKGLSVRERFDNIRMDYIDKTNLIGDQRWSDRITYDGRWENNLFNFFHLTISKLTSTLKRPFRMEGIVRTDDTPIHKAIREAVTNAIIHADMLITGVLKIEKHDNCFMISNPGTLKLPIDKIYSGGNSKARNPRIQNMMRMIGYGENIGSGFPTILKAWSSEQWRKPDLVEDTKLQQVDLKLWMSSLLPDEIVDFLQKLYGEDLLKISSDAKTTLATAAMEGIVTNERMQMLLGKNSLEIGKILSKLLQYNMLVINGQGRWSCYTINTDYQSVLGGKTPQVGGEKLPKLEGKTPQVGGETPQVENGDSLGLPVNEGSLQRRLQKINNILNFCAEPKTLTEIAAMLNVKDKKFLKKNYIKPLLGVSLEMTNPEHPTASNQKYVTISNRSDNNRKETNND